MKANTAVAYHQVQQPPRKAAVVQLHPEQPKEKQQRGAKLVEPKVGQMRHGIRAYATDEGKRFLALVRVKGFKKETQGGFADFMDAYNWLQARIKALKQGAVQAKDGAYAQGPGDMMLSGADGLLMQYANGVQASAEPMSDNLYGQYLRLAGCAKSQIKGTLPRIKSLEVRVADLNANVLTKFCDERKAQGVKPSSALDEYSRISTALKAVAFKNEWFTWQNPMTAAVRAALFAAGKLAESDGRERRPENGEFPALIKWLTAWEKAQWADRPRLEKQRADQQRWGKTYQHPLPEIPPMADILRVSVLAGPRRSTLLAMRWSKLDADDLSIKVMVKDKKGVYQADSKTRRRETDMPIIPQVVEIMKRQPRTPGEDRVFPYSQQRIQAVWQMAREALAAEKKADGSPRYPGIETLRYHDLRHEAATTILDAVGGDMTKAMKFTTHKTHRHFLRYVTRGKKVMKGIAAAAGANMALPE